jgi:hypothetical protein
LSPANSAEIRSRPWVGRRMGRDPLLDNIDFAEALAREVRCCRDV